MSMFRVIVEPEYAGVRNDFAIEADKYEIDHGILHLWKTERGVLERVASFRNWNTVERLAKGE